MINKDLGTALSNDRNKPQPNKFRVNNYPLPNFYDELQHDLGYQYSYQENIEKLTKIKADNIIDDLSDCKHKLLDTEFTGGKVVKPILEKVTFLTSKKETDNLKLIELIDLNTYMQSKYDLRIAGEKDKAELILKVPVKPEEISKNILENFVKNSNFDSAQQLLNINSRLKDQKKCDMDIVIQYKNVNHIYDIAEDMILFELFNPPVFKTNFLTESKDKYEYSIFPFRDFTNEFKNLKFRKFYIIIQTEYETPSDNNLIPTKKLIIKKDIIENFQKMEKKLKCSIVKESDLRKIRELRDVEIDSFFNQSDSVFYSERFSYDKTNLPVFMYLVLVIVSENILGYFNCLEFLTRMTDGIFAITDFKAKFFNETLIKIIGIYKNSETELSIQEFEDRLISNYENVINEHKLSEGLKKMKNKHLIPSQRVIVTPTYTKFVPYVQDQGNRILRDYLSDPNDGIRLVFKMDNFEEARWNNPYLCDYIKHYLDTGLNIAGKQFRFFCYSQSQFRSMSCWLVVNPEEILQRSGKFHEIDTVAKYGARIGQTLTTTIKTIQIPKGSIIEIPDVEGIKYQDGQKVGVYTFSDGVGKISYDLAERISNILGLEEVPSAFQARFLGCKGVWTVIYEDRTGCIWVRPSQSKFRTEITDNQFFEVCNVSKYIKAYLNRQVILLLSALGVDNQVFINRLIEYKNNLEDEKFILSLINYEEWSRIFMNMHLAGLNRFNDRLIRSIVSSNREILYRELKSKAKIYIKEGIQSIGIMDEFGILEYGEAYLHIYDKGKVDIVLDKPCVVVKCPCLHPGDVRLLKFRSDIPKFENYKNVVIFPQQGPRPHPNEISGGDLDGDLYYVFYDDELCKINPVPPMDYTDNSKKNKKENITLKDVIDFFAVYVNNNNLGLIADAHLAHADQNTANNDIAINLALKFSKAVDAPKTGEDVRLEEEENPKAYPHYMGKTQNKTYTSNHVLGKLFDQTLAYMDELKKKKNEKIEIYFDPDMIIPGFENYMLEALHFYGKYYNEILSVIKTNEIQNESELLTGNNVDESSTFGKRKHNYDVIERIAVFMAEKFKQYSNYFENSNCYVSNVKISALNSNKNKRASAYYYVSYNILNILEEFKEEPEILKNYKSDFEELLEDDFEIGNCSFGDYVITNYGLEYSNIVDVENWYVDHRLIQVKTLKDDLEKVENRIFDFLKKEMRNYQILPINDENEDNQYKILSFPWCTCGNILTEIKKLR
jgi:hypothetical protein